MSLCVTYYKGQVTEFIADDFFDILRDTKKLDDTSIVITKDDGKKYLIIKPVKHIVAVEI